MAAVGVAALLLWGAMMGLRSYDYYRLASYYGDQELGWREIYVRDRGNPAPARSIGVIYGPQVAEYYAPLARKYRRAMWRPWMPVAPDPHAPGYDQWLEQERRAKAVAADPSPPGHPPPKSQ